MMPRKYALPELPEANTLALDDAHVNLPHTSGRRVGSKRLEAIHIVMGIFLRHLDPGTLYVGHWSPQGDFIPLDMNTIASEADLCRRRYDTGVLYLKKVGFVSIFPRHRGNVCIDNLSVLNAILYVLENGCKCRKLPKEFGNWHTIYTRMNRWARSGTLDRILASLQQERLINIRIEAISLDSSYIKVHPDACGTLKKRATVDGQSL